MNDASSSKVPWLRILGSIVACVAIVAASVVAIVVINRTEPTAQQIDATRKSAALVETFMVQRGTYSPQLEVLGSVEPAREVVLGPRVEGQVMRISEKLEPGGRVRQGDLLVELDPADFANALSIRESELEQAEASLEIERGRQTLAKKELALLEGTIDEANRALVLREPQIASILAQVNAAQAAIERAQLNLERTKIDAPFDAQVLDVSVNVGSQVRPGDALARLVGVEKYWVIATVPQRNLQWVQLPDPDGLSGGAAVTLRDADSWGPGIQRYGRVTRLIGALDQQTRLARILITVDDPLGQRTGAPALILGALLKTTIEGRPIEDVVRLPREHVHQGDTVWVMKDEKLDVREAEVIFRDARFAYVRSGLETGEEVVTTTLATVADGIGLRKIDQAANPGDGQERVE